MNKHGFLLFETMLGVAIFAIGILVLAKSMEHCLEAELARREDQLARAALEMRITEIEGGAFAVSEEEKSDALSGRFTGITLYHSRKKADLTNEEKTRLDGMQVIHLEARWKSADGERRKAISFLTYEGES